MILSKRLYCFGITTNEFGSLTKLCQAPACRAPENRAPFLLRRAEGVSVRFATGAYSGRRGRCEYWEQFGNRRCLTGPARWSTNAGGNRWDKEQAVSAIEEGKYGVCWHERITARAQPSRRVGSSAGVFGPERGFRVVIRAAKHVVRPPKSIVRRVAAAAEHRLSVPGSLHARTVRPGCMAAVRPQVKAYCVSLLSAGGQKETT
jgi:hypothetical protein